MVLMGLDEEVEDAITHVTQLDLDQVSLQYNH
jgi:hypothetical protein